MHVLEPIKDLILGCHRENYAAREQWKEEMARSHVGRPPAEDEAAFLDEFLDDTYGFIVTGGKDSPQAEVIERYRRFVADSFDDVIGLYILRQEAVWGEMALDSPAPGYLMMPNNRQFDAQYHGWLQEMLPRGDHASINEFYARLAQEFYGWAIKNPEGKELCTFRPAIPEGLLLVPKERAVFAKPDHELARKVEGPGAIRIA